MKEVNLGAHSFIHSFIHSSLRNFHSLLICLFIQFFNELIHLFIHSFINETTLTKKASLKVLFYVKEYLSRSKPAICVIFALTNRRQKLTSDFRLFTLFIFSSFFLRYKANRDYLHDGNRSCSSCWFSPPARHSLCFDHPPRCSC